MPAVVSVTAVVVTQGRTRYLPHTLEAVRSQSVVPDAVVVVDVAASQAMSEYHELQLGGAKFLAAPHARSFGQAVDIALASRGTEAPPTWIWLLHDDSAPEPGALAEQLRAVEHSAAVAIAGAKQRRWDLDGDSDGLLLEVGFTISPLGRRMTGIDEHEIDQGQHDAREDVFAVGLAGALVRTSVWTTLGGTDPEYGVFGDGLDLCRRARLAGHRIVVVPRAVVRHAQASLLDLREEDSRGEADDARVPDVEASYGARRRSHLHYRLVSVAAPMLVPAVLAMILWAPFQAMYRLAIKRPAQARDELLAPLWAILRVRAVARSRRSVRRTSVLPRRALAPLQGTWRDVLGERRDHRLAHAEEHRTSTAPTDLERAELRMLARRRRAMLSLLVAGLLALTAAVFGSVLATLAAGGRLVGGALLPAGGDLAGIWQAATGGWVADGLGSAAPADPFVMFLLPLAVLGGGALQPAVGVLVVLSFVVAGTGAWFGAGGVTRSVWLRAWAVLVWIAAPSFVTALGEGRLGALVAHAALPWVALGILRALGVHARDELAPALRPRGAALPNGRGALRRRRQGSVGAAAAAGLALLVAVSGAPVLFPVVVVALGVVAVAARQHRRYLLLVLLPSLVLLAPYWYHVATTWTAGGWRLLAASPGVPLASDGAPAWQQLLGTPEENAAWFGLEDGMLGQVARLAPLASGVLIVVLALVALFRARAVGAACAWFVAALGLAAAVTTGAVEVAVSGDGPVRGWPGAAVSVVVLALLGAALLGAPGLRSTPRRVGPAVEPDGPAAAAPAADESTNRRGAPAGWRLGGVALLAVVGLAVPVVSVVSWTLSATGQPGAVGELVVVSEPVVAKVGQQMQDSEREVRVLSLDLSPEGVLEYAMLRGDGPQMIDASSVVQGRAMTDPAYAQADLPAIVAGMATGSSAGAAKELADLGVGAIVLPAPVAPDGSETDAVVPDAVPSDPATTTGATADSGRERAELVARLDMVPGLERVTEGQSSVLWRVAPGPDESDAPAWARVVDRLPAGTAEDADEPVVAEGYLPARDKSVATRVAAGGPERAIVLAETAAPGWTATLDGRALERAEVEGRQAFLLGPDGGTVRIDFVPAHRLPWLVAAGLTLLIFVLLAVPVGRRRTGTR